MELNALLNVFFRSWELSAGFVVMRPPGGAAHPPVLPVCRDGQVGNGGGSEESEESTPEPVSTAQLPAHLQLPAVDQDVLTQEL